jgi:hypothetical protein
MRRRDGDIIGDRFYNYLGTAGTFVDMICSFTVNGLHMMDTTWTVSLGAILTFLVDVQGNLEWSTRKRPVMFCVGLLSSIPHHLQPYESHDLAASNASQVPSSYWPINPACHSAEMHTCSPSVVNADNASELKHTDSPY